MRDHGPHDGESGKRGGIDGARPRLLQVGVADGQRTPQPVGGLGPLRRAIEIALGGELAQKPGNRRRRPRRIALFRDEGTRRRPCFERGNDSEIAHETQKHVHRESVEMLGAEDEARGEERADVGIGNAGQQLRQLLGARGHGAGLYVGRPGLRLAGTSVNWSADRRFDEGKPPSVGRVPAGGDGAAGRRQGAARRDPRLRWRRRRAGRADARRGPAPEPGRAEEPRRLFAADADGARTDARLLGDVHDGARSGRARDLRLSQAQPGRPRADLRRRGRDDGEGPVRQVERGGPGPRRGAALLGRRAVALLPAAAPAALSRCSIRSARSPFWASSSPSAPGSHRRARR